MTKPILFAVALLLCACEDEELVPTFGLELSARASDREDGQGSTFCIPPSPFGGYTRAMSIDDWEVDEEPPHLFLEADADGEDNVYRVQVYTASEREQDGIWWVPSEILAEREYDSRFGERGESDSLMVEFEGQQYTVEARGLPPGAACR